MKYIIIYGILLGGVLCGGTNAVGAVRDSGACEEKVEAYSSVWLSQIHKALNGQGVVLKWPTVFADAGEVYTDNCFTQNQNEYGNRERKIRQDKLGRSYWSF